ncbi:MAG: alpha-ketoglutarate-dependent 2,4-dichlorophenoxyacetate dioxygenase [Gammaproteobacteria bacterium]|jgi:alpha-ketoglutarate-dependent 2,4-dichlorophenoxyacetate dioxygenase
MSVSIHSLHEEFAGEVSGIDITKPLSPADVAAIEAGMDRFAVLVLHDQQVSDEQQMAFSANFGPLLNGANTTMRRENMRLNPAFADVSNIDKEGRLLHADDRRRRSSLGNRLWHSDASFRVIPARYSLLSARVVPPQGGNTEFSDMRAAYHALDDATRSKIEDLVCEHSQMHSRMQLGFTEYLPEERKTLAPVHHRLVRTHASTGRKSIYLSAHIGRIIGWPVPEALAFIRDLVEHATQREFVHAHSWRAGDLVIWDNRCTMHRVRSYDDLEYPRDLRRTTTLAEGPTAEQPTA